MDLKLLDQSDFLLELLILLLFLEFDLIELIFSLGFFFDKHDHSLTLVLKFFFDSGDLDMLLL